MYQLTAQGLAVSTDEVLDLCRRAFIEAERTGDATLMDYANTVYSSVIHRLRDREQMLPFEVKAYIDEILKTLRIPF